MNKELNYEGIFFFLSIGLNITQNEKAPDICCTTLCLWLTIPNCTIKILLRDYISCYMFSFLKNRFFFKCWVNKEQALIHTMTSDLYLAGNPLTTSWWHPLLSFPEHYFFISGCCFLSYPSTFFLWSIIVFLLFHKVFCILA